MYVSSRMCYACTGTTTGTFRTDCLRPERGSAMSVGLSEVEWGEGVRLRPTENTY